MTLAQAVAQVNHYLTHPANQAPISLCGRSAVALFAAGQARFPLVSRHSGASAPNLGSWRPLRDHVNNFRRFGLLRTRINIPPIKHSCGFAACSKSSLDRFSKMVAFVLAGADFEAELPVVCLRVGPPKSEAQGIPRKERLPVRQRRRSEEDAKRSAKSGQAARMPRGCPMARGAWESGSHFKT